jgi:hypothetical protein
MEPASFAPPATDDETLARDMIAVHGAEAAAVARGNARSAALGGQGAQAKSWLRIVGLIQQYQTDSALAAQGPGNVLPTQG